MLETFRKYTGLMFVVLILLFIGLVFFGSSSSQSVIAGPKVAFANGKGFTQKEFDRTAKNPVLLLQSLVQRSPARHAIIEPYLGRLGVVSSPFFEIRLTKDQLGAFLVNRIGLQRAMDEYGVAASDDEIQRLIQEDLFQLNGKFDYKTYDDFIKDRLPKFGMNEKHLYEILGEIVATQKLAEIMGSGIPTSREHARTAHLFSNQKVSYSLISYRADTFKEDLTPTDEEIKAHWEANKAAFKSKPKRKLTYVLARPDFAELRVKKKQKQDEEAAKNPVEGTPTEEDENEEGGCGQDPVDGESEPEETVPVPEGEETPQPEEPAEEEEVPAPGEEQPVGEVDLPDEAPVTPGKDPVDESPVGLGPEGEAPIPGLQPEGVPFPDLNKPTPTPEEIGVALSQDERNDAINIVGGRLDDMREELREQNDEGFEEMAKAAGFEVRTTELVTKDRLPLDLRGNLRGGGGSVSDKIFGFEVVGDTAADRTAEILKVGSDQWFLFRIDEVAEPRELSFEEAKEEAKDDLITVRADEKVKELSEKQHKDLEKALAEGKSFEAAAKELDIKSVERDEIRMSQRPQGMPAPMRREYGVAFRTNPGEVSEISPQLPSDSRTLFLYLKSREVDRADAENVLAIDSQYDRIKQGNLDMGLDNWLAEHASTAEFKFAEEEE